VELQLDFNTTRPQICHHRLPKVLHLLDVVKRFSYNVPAIGNILPVCGARSDGNPHKVFTFELAGSQVNAAIFVDRSAQLLIQFL